jgi:GDP/UDP-N,N'-diacetylbacillosamine 2-epimerase (hydrolysing)
MAKGRDEMARKILTITGTRADYGLMTPIYREIAVSIDLDLELIVTGLQLLPEFRGGLEPVLQDNFGRLHYVSMLLGEDSGKAMAQSLGLAIYGMAAVMESVKPDLLLLQGDRIEILAGALAAVPMNIPVVHMSGGDCSGSIDDSIRNALSKLAHLHLTSCNFSAQRLLAMGEKAGRIYTVGEPALDLIKTMKFMPPEELAGEFGVALDWLLVLATQHPVTTEADRAAWQLTQTLEALAELKLPTIITYPNTDSGGRAMMRVLQAYQGHELIRVIPNLGSVKYLSLMRIAAVLVGNSSSGIIEAPSFKLPAVNIGTRQQGRQRAGNVIDVGYDQGEIRRAILYALHDRSFRAGLADCVNPYGDGNTAPRTVGILRRVKLTPALLTKWTDSPEGFFRE